MQVEVLVVLTWHLESDILLKIPIISLHCVSEGLFLVFLSILIANSMRLSNFVPYRYNASECLTGQNGCVA